MAATGVHDCVLLVCIERPGMLSTIMYSISALPPAGITLFKSCSSDSDSASDWSFCLWMGWVRRKTPFDVVRDSPLLFLTNHRSPGLLSKVICKGQPMDIIFHLVLNIRTCCEVYCRAVARSGRRWASISGTSFWTRMAWILRVWRTIVRAKLLFIWTQRAD